jgi:small GTP-binding protein
MNSTPNGNRKHIVIYGKTNAGKSSLINNLAGQDVALVSNKAGTTTDPVFKAMELIPIGPVLFIDSAGINDKTSLGDLRVSKTLDLLKRTDLAIYLMDGEDIDKKALKDMKLQFKKFNIPYILVINKCDKLDEEKLKILKNEYEIFNNCFNCSFTFIKYCRCS